MSDIVLAEASYVNKTPVEIMTLLKDFAVAQGWTLEEQQTNVAWTNTGGGVYGWTAGTGNYLAMHSTGENSVQDLHFRLWGYYYSTTHFQLMQGCFQNGKSGKDTTNSTNPTLRTSDGTSRYNTIIYSSMSKDVHPHVWIHGNKHFLMLTLQGDDVRCWRFCWGSPKLFDPEETEGMIGCGALGYDHHYWLGYNQNYAPEIGSSAEWNMFMLGSGKRAYNNTTTTSGSMGSPFHGGYVLVMNPTYTDGIRPILTHQIYYLNASSKHTPLGVMPVGRMNTTGMYIGEIITYGSKQYRCFPMYRQFIANEQNGFAVRIV